jgi:hypothetical protein
VLLVDFQPEVAVQNSSKKCIFQFYQPHLLHDCRLPVDPVDPLRHCHFLDFRDAAHEELWHPCLVVRRLVLELVAKDALRFEDASLHEVVAALATVVLVVLVVKEARQKLGGGRNSKKLDTKPAKSGLQKNL